MQIILQQHLQRLVPPLLQQLLPAPLPVVRQQPLDLV